LGQHQHLRIEAPLSESFGSAIGSFSCRAPATTGFESLRP
jgi:hypothetical protein